MKRGLKTKKIKTVIIAPNIEEGSSEGGLDDNVKGIIDTARENEAVVVFALNRCCLSGCAYNEKQLTDRLFCSHSHLLPSGSLSVVSCLQEETRPGSLQDRAGKRGRHSERRWCE